MNVGQLREDLAGIPGDLEVRVELNGRMVAAEGFHRYPRAVVLFESDPDEPHGGRPAGYIAPDESPADSPAPEPVNCPGHGDDTDCEDDPQNPCSACIAAGNRAEVRA